jgi:AmpE protein
MKFLVILICLTINYLWLKDFDRFDDSWFFRFRERMATAGNKLEAESLRWSAALLLTYGVPLLLLAILLWFLQGRALGVPTMIVHILVLLVAFDRTQPGNMAKQFLRHWKEGDSQACAKFLQQQLATPEAAHLESSDAMGEFFSRLFVYRYFERLFVMFFWYMLTGPLVILFAYITYQLRDSHHEDQPEEEVEFVSLVIAVLEWLPVRLLALTFSLAGNFVHCFESFKRTFWTFDRAADTAGTLYSYSRCALTGIVRQADHADEEGEQGDQADSESAAVESSARARKATEIEALVSLMERSQAIWLVLLALLTIFAL